MKKKKKKNSRLFQTTWNTSIWASFCFQMLLALFNPLSFHSKHLKLSWNPHSKFDFAGSQNSVKFWHFFFPMKYSNDLATSFQDNFRFDLMSISNWEKKATIVCGNKNTDSLLELIWVREIYTQTTQSTGIQFVQLARVSVHTVHQLGWDCEELSNCNPQI